MNKPLNTTTLSAAMRAVARRGAYNQVRLDMQATALEVVGELYAVERVSLSRVQTQIQRSKVEYFIATGRVFTQ